MEQIKQYLERYQSGNDEERDAVLAEYQVFLATLNDENRQAARTMMRDALRPAIAQSIREMDTLVEKANLALKGKITYQGQEYVFGDWVTIADYCRLHNFKPSRVQNWIEREVVPRQNVVVIHELNNLKLLKNIPYRP